MFEYLDIFEYLYVTVCIIDFKAFNYLHNLDPIILEDKTN